MNRTALWIVLGIGACVGALFAVYPGLDVTLSAPFWNGRFYGDWVMSRGPWAVALRNLASWLVALIAAPVFVVVILKLLLPRRPILMPGRAVLLMISTLALGPGLIVNVILKDNWHRPRPFHLQEFAGPSHFVPWWDPRGSCDTNCSFVAGEPAGAFWTMAPAAVVPPAWRAAAYGAAIVFGAAVGLLRISAGGHFFTDVVFAGIVTFLVIFIVHGLLYRWPRTRVSEAAIERLLERITAPVAGAVTRIVARLRGAAPGG